MSRADRFTRIAEQAAKLSACSMTLGAVVTRGNVVLATASNRSRNVPVNAPEGAREVHAEVAALSLVKAAKPSTVYVTRLNRNGEVTMSRPCRRCRAAILESGVKEVVYSDWHGVYQTERVSVEWASDGDY